MSDTAPRHDHSSTHGHAGSHSPSGADGADGGDHAALFATPEAVDFLDLEAVALGDLVSDAVDRLSARAAVDGRTVERIADLGCGTGAGSIALATAFTDASVVAVDGSPAMLARARTRLAGVGLDRRMTLVERSLDDGLEDLGPVDLVWASMALHHVGDETAMLQRMAALAPGGMICLVERGEPLRIDLPADDGWPGLHERVTDAFGRWFAQMRHQLPGATESEDYPAMIAAAGLTLVDDCLLRLDASPPLSDDVARFARQWTKRAAAALASHLDADDLRRLEELTESSEVWSAVTLRVARRLLVAHA